MQTQNKNCQNCKKNFIIEPEDFTFYDRINVPPPTFCPECRNQRRMAWRNERTLHRNKCAKTGKSLISCFSPGSPFTVYDRDVWWGDEWDPMSYGSDYDFKRPFFTQFRALLERTPQPNLFIGKCVNTFYGNYIGEFRNAYLVSASWEGENIIYGSRCNSSKDCMDMFSVSNCQFCYDDVTSNKCYETFFSQNVEACTSSYFLYDCKNCISCFGCANLRSKSYCLWNEQLTKEEYEKRVADLDIGNYHNFLKISEKFKQLKLKSIYRFANITKSTDVTGDNIVNSNNSKNCFDLLGEVKDCKYITNSTFKQYTSYDGYGVGANCELLYEAMDSGINASRLLFDLTAWECLNTEYSINCHGSNNLFGCNGLRNRSYCILNKQYTKEEYEKLIPQIRQQMMDIPYVDKAGRVYKSGEYFPIEISFFGYNETVAGDYFPLAKEEVLKNGYNWIEKEKPEYEITHKAKDLPARIVDAKEEILNAVIECETCSRAYKIIKDELSFLKRFNLPLPRNCFECRHQKRFKLVNFPRLYHRQCMCILDSHLHKGKCGEEFETTYAPDRPEIIYCEKCFKKEVY